MPCIPFKAGDGSTGILCTGGPVHTLMLDGREIPFEMHPWSGPWPLHRKTLAPLKNIPAGFWEAFERWQKEHRGEASGDDR